MFSLMSKVVASVLMSASTITTPTTPNALPFGATAYVTAKNQIRVAVEKTSNVPVVVLLRDKNKEILFHQSIHKKEAKYVVKLDVNELADGQYELEVKSNEGSIRKQLNLSAAPVQQVSRTVIVQ